MQFIKQLFGLGYQRYQPFIENIFPSARRLATSSYGPFAQDHPILANISQDQFEYFVTIAGVQGRLSLINDSNIPYRRKVDASIKVIKMLNDWNATAQKPLADFDALIDDAFEQAYAKGEPDSRQLYISTYGNWIVSQLIGRAPMTQEELSLSKAIGTTVLENSIKDWPA